MTQQQAIEIIKHADSVYEMNMSKEKAKLWLSMLMKNADYEPSKKALHEYITSGNAYPPILPNILRRSPKILKFDEIDEKTKEHRHKMRHDPEYCAKKQALLDEFKRKLAKEAGEYHD